MKTINRLKKSVVSAVSGIALLIPLFPTTASAIPSGLYHT
jgi:hypothetical protein